MGTVGKLCFPVAVLPLPLCRLFSPLSSWNVNVRLEVSSHLATVKWPLSFVKGGKKISLFYLVEHTVTAFLLHAVPADELMVAWTPCEHEGRILRRGGRSLEKWSAARTSELRLHGLASYVRSSLPRVDADSL